MEFACYLMEENYLRKGRMRNLREQQMSFKFLTDEFTKSPETLIPFIDGMKILNSLMADKKVVPNKGRRRKSTTSRMTTKCRQLKV